MVEGNGSDKAPAETMTLQNLRFNVHVDQPKLSVVKGGVIQ